MKFKRKKMYRFLLLSTIIFAFVGELSAEIIDGPANIRETANGEILFTLYDNAEVTCSRLEDNWYRIGLAVRISETLYNSPQANIPAGYPLIDINTGEVIGKTLVELPADLPSTRGPVSNRIYIASIFGVTFRGNIKRTSLPELRLQELLNEMGSDLTLTSLNQFMETFDFTDAHLISRLDNQYTAFWIYESWLDDMSPMDRIRLIFKNAKLVAIVHSRELTIAEFESIILNFDEQKLIILKNLTVTERVAFIQLIRDAYEGVD